MTLSILTEDFLKYILEVKKPKDLVIVEEKELSEKFKSQIFNLADELEQNNLIKNLTKFGQPGNRGIHFHILPNGLSYFESKKEKRGPFKNFWFPIILVLIPIFISFVQDLIRKDISSPPQSPSPVIESPNPSLILPTLTSTTTANPDLCSFSNEPMTIGIMDLGDNYIYADIFDRLNDLGLQPTWISPNSTYNDFSKYDVIYLPSGWSIIDSSLELYPKFLQDYVKINGGGLIVEQPNSERELSPAFLPYKITYINNKMDPEDWPVFIYDPSTSLTSGLDISELPGPMDCAEMDSSYAPIVKGSKTGCTSLAITSYGKGRILLNMGNSSPSMEVNGLPMISDIALCRMFGWVTKELDR